MYYKNMYVPDELKPISMWGYFGWSLLFFIPVAGFVVLCVFALGGTSNVNLKNYARSYFCWFLIMLVIFGIALAIAAATGGISALLSWLRK